MESRNILGKIPSKTDPYRTESEMALQDLQLEERSVKMDIKEWC